MEAEEGVEEVADVTVRIDTPPFEAWLISRARDCDATARVVSVSSCDIVGVPATAPLPFRTPRFLRLLVEVDLEVIMISREDSCGSSCSSTTDILLRTSDTGRSYAGSREGARDKERVAMAGVRIAEDAREAGRDVGRREGGTDVEMGYP